MRLNLAQAAEVLLGRQRAPQYEAGESVVPYLRSANVADGALDLTDVKQMNFTLAEQRVFALKPGDVLLTEGSGSRETVGTSAVWRGEISGPVCFQNTLLRLRPRAGVTDGRYLAWWARYARTFGLIAAASSGANILHIGSDGLKSLRILVPVLEEQRRVADFLDDRVARIDQIITIRRQQAALVQAWFDSSRAKAVLGASWPERRLSHLARMGTGHTPSRSNDDFWTGCTIPWLTTSDVHRFRLDEIDVLGATELHISPRGLENSAAVLHPAGTVALSRTASAGFSIIMGRHMATSQDFVTWTCGPDLLPSFLLHVLRARRAYLLGYLSMGSTHKTIYFPHLMDLTIALPDVRTQRSAVDEVAEDGQARNEMLHSLRRQLNLLTEYKSSLITAAVNGEIDVTTAGSGIPG